MQPLTLQECQQEALKVLIKFDEICKKNHFKYFLIYGTLLGAIRHNGFIPWDDDLDVMMPREDFDNFIRYAKDNAKELLPFKLCDRSNTKNYWYGIPRFSNLEFTYVNEHSYEKAFELGTFIDVYPLDNYGSNFKDAENLWKKFQRINRMFSWYINSESPRGLIVTMVKSFLHLYMKIIKGAKYEKKIEDEIREAVLKNTSEKDAYVGLLVWASKVVLYEKAKLQDLETIDHLFEGHMFPIPKCYDYMLKQSYGDYMKLPPEEERNPYHGYNIYRR